MELSHATIIARTIKAQLEYFCEEGKCIIVGSVRREVPEVGDIELCVIPKKKVQGQVAMFEDVPKSSTETPCKEFIVTANTIGKIIKGTPHGRYMQFLLKEGIKLDLFILEEREWGRMVAIRTGSAEYSHKILALGWRKQGWVGTDNGLRLEKECFEKDIGGGKKKWTCTVTNPTLPPSFPTEKSFFEFVKVDYIPPQERNL